MTHSLCRYLVLSCLLICGCTKTVTIQVLDLSDRPVANAEGKVFHKCYQLFMGLPYEAYWPRASAKSDAHGMLKLRSVATDDIIVIHLPSEPWFAAICFENSRVPFASLHHKREGFTSDFATGPWEYLDKKIGPGDRIFPEQSGQPLRVQVPNLGN